MVKLIRGPADCEDSHQSAADIEQRIRDIDGVLDVCGEDGQDIEFANKIYVTLDSRYRGKDIGQQAKTEIERLAGCNVRYEWRSGKTYQH